MNTCKFIVLTRTRSNTFPLMLEALVKTKLKQDSKRRCLKAECHVVANASMHINSDSLAVLVASSKPISLGAGPTGRERLPEVQATEDVAGTEQSTRRTDEQHQPIHRDTVGAHTQIGTEMNANSACAQNKNLLMLGAGKEQAENSPLYI